MTADRKAYKSKYRASHLDELKAKQLAYLAKPETKARIASVYDANREANKARLAAYRARPNVKARAAARDASPKEKARKFFTRAIDCTSTRAEVEAAYATGCHVVSGTPGRIGNGTLDLVMGHIHGGPIVGLIWGWENRALSENALAHWVSLTHIASLHGAKVSS